ncbi:MAG: hypothetical protein HY927_02480 [Elusimicrobia bacterium]|nr:hypothetical protein [Elusimicrobiota bacterium]
MILGPLLLCGCVPWPHFERVTPSLIGTVLRDGAPAAEVRVFLHPRCSANRTTPPCQGYREESRTDEHGRFSFRAERKFRPFVTLGDPIYCWAVCVEHDGAPVTGLRAVDLGHQPDEDQLRCELPDARSRPDEGKGICGCRTCRKVVEGRRLQ